MVTRLLDSIGIISKTSRSLKIVWQICVAPNTKAGHIVEQMAKCFIPSARVELHHETSRHDSNHPLLCDEGSGSKRALMLCQGWLGHLSS